LDREGNWSIDLEHILLSKEAIARWHEVIDEAVDLLINKGGFRVDHEAIADEKGIVHQDSSLTSFVELPGLCTVFLRIPHTQWTYSV
jgi:hypothetical protein